VNSSTRSTHSILGIQWRENAILATTSTRIGDVVLDAAREIN